MLEIKHLPNLMLTPLVAWASTESLETLAEQLIGNMKAFVAGTPRNLVMYGVEVVAMVIIPREWLLSNLTQSKRQGLDIDAIGR